MRPYQNTVVSGVPGADFDDYLGVMTEDQGELPVDLIERSGGSVGGP